MIPDNITRDSILKAIDIVDKQGVPLRRKSKIYNLFYNNNYYPPKYIISIANSIVNGRELESTDFKGGKETNNFLMELGFIIVDK